MVGERCVRGEVTAKRWKRWWTRENAGIGANVRIIMAESLRFLRKVRPPKLFRELGEAESAVADQYGRNSVTVEVFEAKDTLGRYQARRWWCPAVRTEN